MSFFTDDELRDFVFNVTPQSFAKAIGAKPTDTEHDLQQFRSVEEYETLQARIIARRRKASSEACLVIARPGDLETAAALRSYIATLVRKRDEIGRDKYFRQSPEVSSASPSAGTARGRH